MSRIDRLLCASVREDAEAGCTDVHAGGILFKVACQQESYFHTSDCELANYRLKMVIWAHGERIRQLCVSSLGSWTHYEQKYAFKIGGLVHPVASALLHNVAQDLRSQRGLGLGLETYYALGMWMNFGP